MTSNLFRVLAGVGLLLGVLPSTVAAQQATTVSGRVTNETSTPLQGATISIPSLGLGTYTNAEGRFTLTVPAGRATGQSVTITARRIGFNPVQRAITLTPGAALNYDVSLTGATTQLEGVIVTALGQEREKRSLGVAAQSISGSDLNQTQTPNIVNALSGKIAGVKVTGSTNFGGSSRIVIRGENSIGSNNQPLWVVDGIPVDNSNLTNVNQARGYGGFDYGNAVSDLNTEDIESVSVLKGPAAAALYGSRAANGAIVVTTRSGKNGRNDFSASGSSSVTFDQLAKLPDYQNSYGQGVGGQFGWKDGAGGGVGDGEDASWGPRLDGRTTGCAYIPSDDPRYNPTNPSTYDLTAPCVQWFSNGQPAPWVSHPDNVRDFFQTGKTVTNNVSATGSSDRANFRLSLGSQDVSGIVPTSSTQRINATANGSAMLGTKINANATVQFVHNRGNNRPGTGYDEFNPMMGFVWFGRQVDSHQLQQLYNDSTLIAANRADDINCCQANWNYNYHNNPYFNLNNNNNHDDRNRFIGSAQLTYRPTDWLTAMVRSGSDFYRSNRGFNVDFGWVGGFFDPFTNGVFTDGGFSNEDFFVNENNTDFLLTSVTNPLTRLGLTVNLGGNLRSRSLSQNWIGTDALVAPGVYNVANAATQYTPFQYNENRKINSLYGSTQFAYNDVFFVDVTGRNDWSSTLPKGNNSFFYPSVSSSLVFTDLLPGGHLGGALTYGKLRGAWTRVGNDADPYLTIQTFSTFSPFGSAPRFSVKDVVANKDLKPEQTDAWEVGTELSFLDGRAGLDATYYQKKTTNQILNIDVSRTTGFSNAAINAGQLSNKGVELQLTAMPVKLANSFTWDVTANYANNRNRVDALYGDLTSYLVGRTFFSTRIEARLGQPYGSITGHPALRDDQGRLILDDTGLPQAGPTSIIGNIQPNWTGGLINHFRYKNLDFSAQIDAKVGGQLWSATNRFGTYAGILQSTLQGREISVTEPGIDIQGVDDAGNPITSHVTAEDYYKTIDGIEEYFVYDASYVKLRELRLGWNVQESLTRRLSGYKVGLALVGRNLWTHSNAPNIDPESAFSAGNSQGLEFGQLPATRSFGIQLNVTP
jgi:TonB-linked SusC/RagA family outer membrane protein